MRLSKLTQQIGSLKQTKLAPQGASDGLGYSFFSRTSLRKACLQFLLCCLMGDFVLAPAMVMAQTTPNVASNSEVGTVTLSFMNADIDSVASVVAKATGQTILVDPQVKGTINLISNKPVSKAKALDSFSTALRTAGFALVEVNGVYRVVTQADAKLVSTSVSTGKTKQEGDQIITRVFRLSYESANNLLPVLRPLVSPNNTINAYPGNNTIVVTDYASNIQRIATLIDAIDAPTTTEVQTIKLQHAFASDIAAILSKVLDTGAAGTADPALKTIILAEPRSNSILVRSSSAERVRQVRILVARLDIPGNKNGNIWVVPLKNAEASKLAITLRAIVAADAALSAQVAGGNAAANPAAANPQQNPAANPAATGSGTSLATSALVSTSTPNVGGFIQAEPATNSLIITANEPLYRNLRQVIEELDRRRTQVYIEALIVEVSSETAAELGIQWNFLLGSGNQNVGFGGTNFNVPNQGPGANIIGLGRDTSIIANPGTPATGVQIPPAPGLNLGMISRFNGVYAMSALIRALETATGTNILSTPNLITLDNEEARIIVGRNIPILTGSYAQTGTTSTVTPFQTIVRQDVGITLRVRPQISANGIVRMQIFQEVSSVVPIYDPSGPIINKRNIESNVLVDDGQMIVLGGLITDEYGDQTSGIPFLSSIPIIGNLFRYDNKKRIKSNLLVFIRPYVLRDKDENEQMTKNRLDLMQTKEDQFKQLPMLLPTEKNMPNVKDAEVPLVPPRLPSDTINTSPAIKPSSPPSIAPIAPALPANK
ncbi:type II secretion system secretin GspD [Polynucleobacter sp. IMCC 29146]|uniref:type II secretion system secretin GspD n=1 Tax=Polynucleobacter sp. IMCC 29146 TaxID=2780953 RepID=UPI001F29AFFE|nr:type II secretion system secretin GspD [Polynucleobacter sp. IMCC 29146]MCE7530382.1 type II secretion system secretin GspD [Polynucleobacter sp. IMCC 29146]